jgi:aspartyl-tRNA(Asn)/glutamyl-tRNA(Gln) amidotransferase subunit C
MPIDTHEVARIAALARLDLDPETIAAMRGQLEAILEHVAMLDSLQVAEVPATAHAREDRAPLRPDDPAPTLSVEEAVANAPDSLAGFFRVPRVLGE